jgi:hypothetical protein
LLAHLLQQGAGVAQGFKACMVPSMPSAARLLLGLGSVDLI